MLEWDVHKRVCRSAVVNDEIVNEFSFMNSENGIRDFMIRIEAFWDEAVVDVESTANHRVRLYDFLEAREHRAFSDLQA